MQSVVMKELKPQTLRLLQPKGGCDTLLWFMSAALPVLMLPPVIYKHYK